MTLLPGALPLVSPDHAIVYRPLEPAGEVAYVDPKQKFFKDIDRESPLGPKPGSKNKAGKALRSNYVALLDLHGLTVGDLKDKVVLAQQPTVRSRFLRLGHPRTYLRNGDVRKILQEGKQELRIFVLETGTDITAKIAAHLANPEVPFFNRIKSKNKRRGDENT